MWRRLKNLFLSLKTYRDLSPDLAVRRRVKRGLRDRAVLSSAQWFQQHGRAIDLSPTVVAFADRFLEGYGGLPFAQLLPNDRLEADLRWIEICWFDWQDRLCEDFEQAFGFELEELEAFDPITVADLLSFLDRQIPVEPDCC